MRKTILLILLICMSLCTFTACVQTSSLEELPSKYVNGQMGKIHYKVYGEGMPAIVFVHGFGCDINAWSEQFPYFSDKSRMVFIDLPGYGKSDKPLTEYSLDFYADAVKTVLDELDMKNTVLVGHSLGTAICRRVVQKYPDLAAKLCDVDGVYCFYPSDPAEYAAYKAQTGAFVNLFDDKTQYKANIEGFIGSLFIPSTPEKVKEYATNTMMQTPQHVANSTMKHLVEEEYWDKSVMTIPTLVFCSKHSQIPDNYHDIMQMLYSEMEYHEWDFTGHFMMMEDPEKFNTVLENFYFSADKM